MWRVLSVPMESKWTRKRNTIKFDTLVAPSRKVKRIRAYNNSCANICASTLEGGLCTMTQYQPINMSPYPLIWTNKMELRPSQVYLDVFFIYIWYENNILRVWYVPPSMAYSTYMRSKDRDKRMENVKIKICKYSIYPLFSAHHHGRRYAYLTHDLLYRCNPWGILPMIEIDFMICLFTKVLVQWNYNPWLVCISMKLVALLKNLLSYQQSHMHVYWHVLCSKV